MKKAKKSQFKNIWSIIAIIISVISLLCDKCQSDKIDKQQFIINAINNRPFIVIDTISFDSTIFRLKTGKIGTPIDDSIGNIQLKGLYTTNTTIRLKNIGNSSAKLRLYSSIDTICGKKIIREELLSENYKFFPNKHKMEQPYYVDILPNQCYNLNVNSTFSNFRSKTIQYHIFILYQNELKHFFDTYYWINIQQPDLNLSPHLTFRDSIIIPKEIRNLELLHPHNDSISFSSSIYSIEENIKTKSFITKYNKNSLVH